MREPENKAVWRYQMIRVTLVLCSYPQGSHLEHMRKCINLKRQFQVSIFLHIWQIRAIFSSVDEWGLYDSSQRLSSSNYACYHLSSNLDSCVPLCTSFPSQFVWLLFHDHHLAQKLSRMFKHSVFFLLSMIATTQIWVCEYTFKEFFFVRQLQQTHFKYSIVTCGVSGFCSDSTTDEWSYHPCRNFYSSMVLCALEIISQISTVVDRLPQGIEFEVEIYI